MEAVEGAGASVTVIDIVKQLARLFHEGEPKWGFVPDKQKYIAELFYQFTQTGAGGRPRPLPLARHALRHVITLFHGYSHDIIMNAIETGEAVGRRSTATRTSQFLFAGGLFGVLAAVNEAVEDSYWTDARASSWSRSRPASTSPTARSSRRAHPDDPGRPLAARVRGVHVPLAHRPERELAADRGGGRRRRRRLRHLPLQPHDRRLRRGPATSTRPSTTPPRPPARRSSSPPRRWSRARSSGGSPT